MAEHGDACKIQGNSDLYGVGVRAGLYTQWGATLVATLFDPSTEEDIRLLNLIIQCAIFLGLCTESAGSRSAVGAIVTQLLLCGSLSSITGDGFNYAGHLPGLMRYLFYTGLSAYGIWFWFTGVDHMTQPDCPHFAFYGGTTFFGWFRSLGKALSIIGVIICSALDIYCIRAFASRFLSSNGPMAAYSPPPRQRPQVELSLLLLSTGLLVFSIHLIEHLIDINEVDVEGVITVGQLIPLIGGGVGVVLVIWKVVARGLFMRRRCWFLFGVHLFHKRSS